MRKKIYTITLRDVYVRLIKFFFQFIFLLINLKFKESKEFIIIDWKIQLPILRIECNSPDDSA